MMMMVMSLDVNRYVDLVGLGNLNRYSVGLGYRVGSRYGDSDLDGDLDWVWDRLVDRHRDRSVDMDSVRLGNGDFVGAVHWDMNWNLDDVWYVLLDGNREGLGDAVRHVLGDLDGLDGVVVRFVEMVRQRVVTVA